MSQIHNAIENAYDAIGAVEVAVTDSEITILKAIKGNDRFKNSSVWVSLPNGKFKHVQSGKVTTASRLTGYTQVFSL